MSCNKISAQLVLKIDSLIVSNIIEIREKDVITSHLGDGPTIGCYLVLENNTDTNFYLDKIEISVEFVKNDGCKCDVQLLWWYVIGGYQGKYIESHKSTSIEDHVPLMHFEEETEYANHYITDHFPELEHILSSLNIVLK